MILAPGQHGISFWALRLRPLLIIHGDSLVSTMSDVDFVGRKFLNLVFLNLPTKKQALFRREVWLPKLKTKLIFCAEKYFFGEIEIVKSVLVRRKRKVK